MPLQWDDALKSEQASRSQINRGKVPESKKRRQEYKDFRFRRRYDHLLRYRLSGATVEEVIEAARELGFNLNIKDFAKKRKKQVASPQNKTLFDNFKKLFKA